jgi:alpha-mannosidase
MFNSRLLPAVLWSTLAIAAPAVKEIYVVPHTHWEGAVFKTREEYLAIGLPHIEKALYLLKKYPDYRFVLDQMCYVRPFVERYPQEEAFLRKVLAEGRLQIAGGTDSMHDSNMPSGESIARQYLLGKSWFRDRLGYDVTTGWGLDTFGHNAQMPQILKLAGMKSYWFQRGVPGIETPAEFLWQGLDGTRIPAFWLPISYAPLHNIPKSMPEFERMVKGFNSRLDPFSKGAERVLMAGADVWEPEEQLAIALPLFNKSETAQFRLRFAVPADYEAVVSKRADPPVVSGELNPVFQGIYSTRIEVKQAMRNMERLLTTVEKLSVLAGWLGIRPDVQAQERAWEPVLFNQAHDLASGVMVDKVYDDSMAAFDYARRSSEDMMQRSLDGILARINTEGNGVPVVVFNTLGWTRADIVEAEVGFSEPGVQSFALNDSSGQPVPVQTIRAERNDDGGIRFARIAFIAKEVPAMGYSVYFAVPHGQAAGSAPAGNDHSTWHEDRGTIENDRYRATFNLWNGDMTSLVLKQNNWEVLSGSANVIAREYDGGDFWELYGTLNGARLTAMKKPIGVPRAAFTQTSSDFVGGSGATRSGPVMSEFRITHPLGKNQVSTTVRFYNGLPRIDISTQLLNQEEFVRYRALFPTSIARGTAMHEIPFGAIERATNQEYPAQNWIDYGDGSRGITLVNRGMPGNNVADGTMMLSLMRSTKLISYGYIGGFEPGVGSDTALGLGRRYTLDYALIPHIGGWREAAPWRAGLEFNNPLIARTAAARSGELPPRWGMLEISDPNVVLSALKPGRDGSSIIRVYEASGRAAKGVRIRVTTALQSVSEANLIEDAGQSVTVRDGAFSFDMAPFEIRTFRLSIPVRTTAR